MSEKQPGYALLMSELEICLNSAGTAFNHAHLVRELTKIETCLRLLGLVEIPFERYIIILYRLRNFHTIFSGKFSVIGHSFAYTISQLSRDYQELIELQSDIGKDAENKIQPPAGANNDGH
ncbi:hypothetical protein A2533_04455 [Candidatus Falkowbacteria bacterium RIFOXYD2_FULL_35_9]|uniref:Uncharacterized protein n=1 Tax=Candidatus Falkowbacteria bacterium RIFOXYC2_FULL_36_12 TaxID=1798002 RepID=A0A1F5T0A1_9BACT|nr:MAG: hypothetical protein A2300_04110 [Candidatus Falkowbacteria bacterium RIFOXYB2_FULL_35_7]OGF32380.1 MAG: hypothetical protein A2478_03615 [Candidatus Falkowbacteria bacterium RIFOXYC2_FULL_36_12]OGF34736.1 MAG: hypothetical protein A2223_00940 [Candidatus Falkowbacteria bacterium RIFOXYA2_FULL_35_8]OGF48369.1 MAG: hypothetical protein A2533_04455 [Candidatus Falkowbacteria bacterium RIFOXYD2_FULL_35_9]